MNPSDIGNAYDEIAHVWASDDFNHQNGLPQHEKALGFVSAHGHALDIGCGCTGRFIDLLKREGFTPEGVDVSATMITLARQRNPGVTFYHEDICEWTLPRQYDFITAWDSLWHIPLTEQEKVITKIVNALAPQGIFIFSFGGLTEASEHRDNCMGPEVYYSTLGTSGFLALFQSLGCTCLHLEHDQPPSPHTYAVIQKN